MNKEKMHLLADLLETIKPVKFNMAYWMSHYNEESDEYSLNNPDEDDPNDSMNLSAYDCNTAGCIAGWAIAMKNDLQVTNEKIHNIEGQAAEYLGLYPSQAQKLFYYSGSNTIWQQHFNHFGFDENRPNDDQIEPKHAAYALRKIADGEWEL